MPNLSPAQMEMNGDAFDEKKILAAKQRTWEAITEIVRRLAPGLPESEGFRIANETLREHGAERLWHRSQVRFGANTLLSFGKKPEQETVLGENDIYFLDLGPIFEGHEADCGATFTTGGDEEMQRCAKGARAIWQVVRDRWFETGESGSALYAFARREVEARGWQMTLQSADGHRLGDFPHALHYKGKLANFDFRPTANRWVLEIQLRHPTRPFGAFYEDLLA